MGIVQRTYFTFGRHLTGKGLCECGKGSFTVWLPAASNEFMPLEEEYLGKSNHRTQYQPDAGAARPALH
jgi:hypothetical protein